MKRKSNISLIFLTIASLLASVTLALLIINQGKNVFNDFSFYVICGALFSLIIAFIFLVSCNVEYDKNIWTVEGEPTTTITVEKPNTVELTCASIVNRLPDVINAEPGYIPTELIGELEYKLPDLDDYVWEDEFFEE